jgi:hypothetical protein
MPTLLQQNDLSNGNNLVTRVIQDRTEAALRNYAVYILNNAGASAAQKTWATTTLENPRAQALKAIPFMQGDPARDLGAELDAMSDADIKILAETAANSHLIA